MIFIPRFFCLKLETAAMIFGVFGVSISAALSTITAFILQARIKLEKKLEDPVELEIFLNKPANFVTMLVISGLFSYLLIKGTKEYNHFYLIPWLVQNGVGLIYLSVQFILLLFSVVVIYSFIQFIITLIVLVIIEAFCLYCFLAIYSLYLQIKSNKDVKNIPRVELV